MRLLLLGPPGSGKGTQAEMLSAKLGIAHISTGEMMRAEVAKGSELGKRVADILARGDFVADDVVAELVAARTMEADAQPGYLLDGFPRTLRQAELLQQVLDSRGHALDIVLELKVSDDEIVRRIKIRAEKALSEGKQPRADDSEDVMRNRLSIYRRETLPLTDHYKKTGILVAIEGEGDINQINNLLLSEIKAKSL